MTLGEVGLGERVFLEIMREQYHEKRDLTSVKLVIPKTQMSQSTTKPTKRPVSTAKTQISLGIFLSALRVAKDPNLLQADSEDCDQTGWMLSRLITLRWTHRSFCWFCRAAAQL